MSSDERVAELERLHATVRACTICHLSASRTLAVPGEGPLTPKVMFIGEGPGRQEDKKGRPFVGAAGRLLDAAIASIGLRREEVFITNVVKCRPVGFSIFEKDFCLYCKHCEESYPDVFKETPAPLKRSKGKCCDNFEPDTKQNVIRRLSWLRGHGYRDKDRKPNKLEADSCINYLAQQLRIMRPKMICTLGDTATTAVLRLFGLKAEGIGKMHGKPIRAGDVTIFPMYHPAAALYTPGLKGVLEEDFKTLGELIGPHA